MAQIAPTPSTPLGPVPTTADPANFDSRADNFLGELPTFQTELDGIADVTYDNAVDAFNNAVASAASAAASLISSQSASASAIDSAASAGAQVWAAGIIAVDAVRWSPLSGRSYRHLVSGSSVLDPSLDASAWKLISITPVLRTVTAAYQQMLPETQYLLTNTTPSGSQAVLPENAVEGDSVKLSWSNGLYTNQLLRPWMPNLVTNGEFLSNSTGWTDSSVAGGAIAWNAGQYLDLVYTSGVAYAVASLAVVVGKKYRVDVDKRGTLVACNVGSSGPGSADYVSQSPSTVNLSAVFTAVSTTTCITSMRNVVGTGSIDNVSVREVITINDIEDDILLDTVAKGTLELRYMDGSWRT